MIRHKSRATVLVAGPRYGQCQISKQFRFVVRFAVACHAAKVEYDVEWVIASSTVCCGDEPGSEVIITACGAVLPVAKVLPRTDLSLEAQAKAYAAQLGAIYSQRPSPDPHWKPRFHEAVYRLDAYAAKDRRSSGFVIEHSSGLALVVPSDTGEWGYGDYRDADPTGNNWRVMHTSSGRSFGLELSFARAVKALLFAASYPVDWMLPLWKLQSIAVDGVPGMQTAGNEMWAKFGNRDQRARAKWRLAQLRKEAA